MASAYPAQNDLQVHIHPRSSASSSSTVVSLASSANDCTIDPLAPSLTAEDPTHLTLALVPPPTIDRVVSSKLATTVKPPRLTAVAFPSVAIDRYGFLITDRRFRRQTSPTATTAYGSPVGSPAKTTTSTPIDTGIDPAGGTSTSSSASVPRSSNAVESSSDDEASAAKDQYQAIWLENQRTQKWIRMIGTSDQDWLHCMQHHATKMKSRIRKGIPDALRGRVWCYLAESNAMMAQNPGVFRDLVCRKNASWSEVIARDIGRTFPKHCLFQDKDSLGQNALLNVLRAYSLHDVEVGYCQGMGFVTAMFLSYLPEEQTFWQLVACLNHKRYDLANLFRPGMPKVTQVMEIFDRLLKRFVPTLAHHLEKEGLHPSMYSSQWFITLFTYSFPFEFVTRVWDIFLNEGWKIIYRVALALMKVSQHKLLTLHFEGIMLFLRELPTSMDCNQVFETCFKIKLRRKQLVQLEAACCK